MDIHFIITPYRIQCSDFIGRESLLRTCADAIIKGRGKCSIDGLGESEGGASGSVLNEGAVNSGDVSRGSVLIDANSFKGIKNNDFDGVTLSLIGRSGVGKTSIMAKLAQVGSKVLYPKYAFLSHMTLLI